MLLATAKAQEIPGALTQKKAYPKRVGSQCQKAFTPNNSLALISDEFGREEKVGSDSPDLLSSLGGDGEDHIEGVLLGLGQVDGCAEGDLEQRDTVEGIRLNQLLLRTGEALGGKLNGIIADEHGDRVRGEVYDFPL